MFPMCRVVKADMARPLVACTIRHTVVIARVGGIKRGTEREKEGQTREKKRVRE